MRFALICYPDPAAMAAPSAEFTYWDTRAQAQQALAELTPCGRRCVGVHTVVAVGMAPAGQPTERTHRMTA